MSFKERMIRFMQGRYGVDQLNRFLTGLLFVLLIVNIFLKSVILNFVVFAMLIFLYIRMFSKNYAKRVKENDLFLKVVSPITTFFHRQQGHAALRKDYRLFKCPGCKQMVKVPKGKGKIAIRCPKCQKEFVRKS